MNILLDAIVFVFLLWSVLGLFMKYKIDNENRLYGLTLSTKKKILSTVLAGPLFWIAMSLSKVLVGIFAALSEIYKTILDYFTADLEEEID